MLSRCYKKNDTFLVILRMKKVVGLTEWERQTLEEGYRNSVKSHFRIRCQNMLMSDAGYKVKEIAKLHKVRTRTIYTWIDKWESIGIAGFIDHFVQTVTQRTAIVLNNASVHHSEEFEHKIE